MYQSNKFKINLGLTIMIISNLLQFAGPLFINLIIGNMMKPENDDTYYYGYLYALGLVLSYFLRVIL